MPPNNSKARREIRKKAAQARQELRGTRKAVDQLLLIRSRPGESSKERDRLLTETTAKKRKKAKDADADDS